MIEDRKLHRELTSQSAVFLVLILITIGATAWFGWAGYNDTSRIVAKIYNEQGLNTASLIKTQLASPQLGSLTVYAALEGDTIVARNNRAASYLATRTWLRFLTTMFGAILIIFGAAFVLGRVNSDAINLQGSGGGITASLGTTSPGLILAVLGVGLMAWPLASPGEIVTNDAASYGSFLISDGGDGSQKATIATPAMTTSAAVTAPPQSRAETDAALKRAGITP